MRFGRWIELRRLTVTESGSASIRRRTPTTRPRRLRSRPASGASLILCCRFAAARRRPGLPRCRPLNSLSLSFVDAAGYHQSALSSAGTRLRSPAARRMLHPILDTSPGEASPSRARALQSPSASLWVQIPALPMSARRQAWQFAAALVFFHGSEYVLAAAFHGRRNVTATFEAYRFMRHPGYFGFLLWAVGTQVMLCNPVSTVAFTYVLWRFFSKRIHRYEEYFLRQFFGSEYEEYALRVYSGLPFIK
nr:unnamed protein product [Digitaria exilis]